MSKKKIFAIVVFIVLGLFMYTFANPLNNNSDDNGANNGNGNNNGNGAPVASNNENTQRNATRNTGRAANATPVAATANTANQDAVIVVDNTNVSPAVNPTVDPAEENKPSIEPIVIDLTMDKLNAIDELTKYKSGYEFTDDTDYKKVIEDYTKKINDSESVKEIKDNLADGKAAIDKLIEEDLSAYKDAAKKEIADYAKSLDLTTDVTELLEGFNNDIDEATTKSAIDKIVEDAKKKLDEIKAAEIAKAKEDAKNEIYEYKKEDETNLPEIVKVKEDAKEEIKNTDDIEKINEIVEAAKNKIDEIINNTEYTVVFYGLMNKKLSTQTVGYKKAATAPKMKANQKGWNNSIEVEFLGWDTEEATLNAVTSDLEVRAQFKVLKATTKISILKEGLKNKDGSEKTISTDVKDFNHPFNKPEAEKDTYLDLTINDAITAAVNNYRGSHIFVYTDDNDTIRSVVNGEPDVYDNNKYKELQYYVLKLQGDRFHCDARVIYNHAAELADAKTAARNAINNYKPVETEDIDEIKTTKSEAINAIKDMTSVEDVKGKVQPTKDAIDKIIANKTYDVTFVGKISSKTVKVGYNKDAVAPTTKEFTNPVYRNVTYKFTKWDKSLNNIKANTKITASYEIEKVVATVFLIGEEYDIPTNRESNLPSKAYSKYKEVELKVTDTIKSAINNDKNKTLYLTDREIRTTLKDANALPTKDGKYKTYEFYAMKFCEGSVPGFHIDGKMFYDRAAEALDNAKEELRDLIKKAEAKSTEGKTDASVKELKDDIKTAKEVVEGNDINAIKDSIKELKKDKLVDIKVTSVTVVDKKKNHEYVEGQSFKLEVKYSNNNGVTDKVIESGYTVNGDTKTVKANQKATVSYKGVESNEFTYTVIAKVITSIKVESAKFEYFLKEDAQLTVTATYNDGDTRILNANEYKLKDYDKNKTTYKGKNNNPRTAMVYLISNPNIKDTFKYSISTFTKEGWDEERIDRLSIKVHKNDHTIEFKGLEEDIKVKKVEKKYTVLGLIEYDDFVVDLEKTNNFNIFKVSDTAYEKLRRTNTIIAGQYVQITYEVNGKTYTKNYIEFFKNLF